MLLFKNRWVTAFIFLAILFFPLPLCAQGIGHRLDSLKQAVVHAKTDTDKVNSLIELSRYTSPKDTLPKINAVREALQLAEHIKWGKGIVRANITFGLLNGNYSKHIESIKYFQQAIHTAEAHEDTIQEALALGFIARAYKELTQYGKAISYYQEAVKLESNADLRMGDLGNMANAYAIVGDYPAALACYDSSMKILAGLIRTKPNDKTDYTLQMASLKITIGDIYLTMSEYGNALENYKMALTLCVQTKKKVGIVISLTDIGKVYQHQKNDAQAVAYYNKALASCRELEDTGEKNLNETIIYNDLGKLYLEQDNVHEAMKYGLNSLSLTGKDPYNKELPTTYTILGEIYTRIGQYQKAAGYLENAVSLSKRSEALDNEKDALQSLSITYQHMKQPGKALEAYKNYIAIRDSVYNIAKTKEMTRMEITADFETKQLADSLRQKQEKQALAADKKVVALQLQRQKAVSVGSIVGVVLVVILAFFIYRNYRQQKKANAVIRTEKQKADSLRVRAEQSEQFKQQFLANMSHEIRTPMNAVSGMTDLLLDKNPRADQAGYLQVISRSSDILLHVINDILDLSKIESGKMEIEQVDFSLADTLKQVKETLSIRCREKGLQLITHIGEGVTDVLVGDPFRLNQVLINLGGNAIKFTEKGSVEIEVKKTATNNDTISLLFSIADTGIGIPEDKLNTIFESFAQVHSSDTRKYGGTGLGLSISRQLVQLQGGSISVESKEKAGATFSFTLAFPAGSAQRLHDRLRSEQEIDGSALNGLRILVADDNEYNRMVVREALHAKADITIDEAINGAEAIKMLEQNGYDAILMDVQMPVMNGLDATRCIRSEFTAPKNQTPVIALTANLLRNDLEKCTEAGMNTYIPKPFKTGQLIAAIAEQTGRKKMTTETKRAKPALAARQHITDLTYLTEFCEGEEERMSKYIDRYLTAARDFENKATEALRADDPAGIAALAHLFKPKWIMMGMAQSAELGQRIEKLHNEQGDEEKIKECLAILITQNRESISELEGRNGVNG